MQEAIRCGNRILERGPTRLSTHNGWKADVKRLVKENAVIILGRKGCCMTHVVKRLLQSLGVNPALYEVEDDVVLAAAGGTEFPVVFIGGRCFGGLDRIMATHITGELTPLLKQAGALWL